MPKVDNLSIGTALDDVRRAQFGVVDVLRRIQGDIIAAYGLGPTEAPYQIIASDSYWRLRDYGDQTASCSLLIVAAPIKRPYIWDLTPSASAIRNCQRNDLHVHLLEWMPARRVTNNNGLDETVAAVSDCVATVSAEARGFKPFIIGHSLGGTLAAIYAASASESIRGLVLLGAPLCFQPEESHFRDALVSMVRPDLPDTDPFPGSLLSHMSALASPRTFIWSRMIDAALSITDLRAIDIHARIERWALDEVPLPGKLVHQFVEWLYRENQLCRGELKIGNSLIGPFQLSVPMLAVVNTTDEVAPLESVKPFIEAVASSDARIIEYPGEIGVCLQHLGILVGARAQSQVWPETISWINSRTEAK